MMADGIIPAGTAYAYRLLDIWVEIIKLSQDYRKSYVIGQGDKEQQAELIAKITTIYGECRPKIQGRTDFKDLPERYEKFSRYYYDPKALTDKGNGEDIFKMTEIVREALEKLKITQYEG